MVIYKTTNLINGKIYVGQDSKNDPKYFGSGTYLKNAISKYGIGNFKKEIIEYCNTKEDLNEREIFWIKKFDAQDKNVGYNLTAGGGGVLNPSEDSIEKMRRSHLGWCPSEETRKKLSELGKKRKGMKFTDSHKENLRKSHLGWCPSEETRKKLSERSIGSGNNFFGKHHNEETRKKLSKLKSGKGKKVYQYDLANNLINIYGSIGEAARLNNIDASSISRCCSGFYKTSNGYLWSFNLKIS